jgi:hypothetical protein
MPQKVWLNNRKISKRKSKWTIKRYVVGTSDIIILDCIWRHNLSMAAILVDTTKFISAITTNKLSYFTVSWYILKLTTMLNVLLIF